MRASPLTVRLRQLAGFLQLAGDQFGRLPTRVGHRLLAQLLHLRTSSSPATGAARRTATDGGVPTIRTRRCTRNIVRPSPISDDEHQHEEYSDQRVHASSSCRHERGLAGDQREEDGERKTQTS